MKKLAFVSAAIFGLSFSLVQADSGNFLDRVQNQLFFGQTFNSSEKATLLELSSEAPRATFKKDVEVLQDQNDKIESSENLVIGSIKTPVQTRTRRNYAHFKTLVKPMPFYEQQTERVIGEPSINIVRRKNRTAQQKLARYRTIFPAYGN